MGLSPDPAQDECLWVVLDVIEDRVGPRVVGELSWEPRQGERRVPFHHEAVNQPF